MARGLFVLWLIGSAIWIALVHWTVAAGNMPSSSQSYLMPPMIVGGLMIAFLSVVRAFR